LSESRNAGQRIVVTGLGVASPLGIGCATNWEAWCLGKQAGRILSEHRECLKQGAGGFELIGAPLPELPPNPAWPCAGSDPLIASSFLAAEEAWNMAQPTALPTRRSVVFGLSKGGLSALFRFLDSPEGIESDWSEVFPHAASTMLGARFDCQGPVLSPVAACATGLAAAIRGVELLKADLCDVVLVGSADVSLLPVTYASFRRLGVLAPADWPALGACRPFDQLRGGFLIGEGAGAIVLERAETAKARGAPVLAEWLGGLGLTDPVGLTQPDPGGETLVKLLQLTLQQCGLSPTEVDHLQLHGTGTRMGDRAEAEAVARVFGPLEFQPWSNSLKGGMGHLLGAAGSVELVASILSLKHGVIPPTVNLTTRDLACPLRLVANASLDVPLSVVIKLSAGFGGHQLTAVLGRPEGRC
jgi:3-oxoacyl-[acyl-carrier-protein] synthase II